MLYVLEHNEKPPESVLKLRFYSVNTDLPFSHLTSDSL